MAPAASAPATSGGDISTSFTEDGGRPCCLSALSRISRSSEKRLGTAMVRPARSGTARTGPVVCRARGRHAARKMSEMAAPFPTPKKRMAMGTQARGLMGRRN